MATVPTETVPSIMPQGGALRVGVPQEAFTGAATGIGELAKGLGVTSDVLAQHAQQYQAVNNQIAARQALQPTLDQIDSLKEDFKANNAGLKASQNLGAFTGKLNDLVNTQAEQLQSPMAKGMFLQNTSRILQYTHSDLTAYAITQRQAEEEKTYQAGKNQLITSAGDHFDSILPQLQANAAQRAAAKGYDPVLAKDFVTSETGGAVLTRAQDLFNNGNIQGAADFLTAHKDNMEPRQYEEALGKLRPALQADHAAQAGKAAVAIALAGTNNTLAAHQTMTSFGWTPEQAAGIVGNFVHESNVNPHGPDGDSGAAQGIAQWHADRRADFEQWAGKPFSQSTLADQLAFANYELTQGKYKSVGDQLRGATSVEDATRIILQGYERPAPQNQTPVALAQRVKEAQGVLAGSTNSTTGGAMTSDQLQAHLAPVLAQADQMAERDYPGNEAIRERYENNAKAQLGLQVSAQKDIEYQNYNQLVGIASQHPEVRTVEQLAQLPGAAALINSLPKAEIFGLMGKLAADGNAYSAERSANSTLLAGQLAAAKQGDTGAFLSQNINAMDLTTKDYQYFAKAQAEMRVKPAVSDKDFDILSKSEALKSQLFTTLGAKTPANAEQYQTSVYRIYGVLQSNLEDWKQQNPNKPLTPDVTAALIAKTFAQQSYTDTFLGIPYGHEMSNKWDFTDQEIASATQALRSANRPVNGQTVARYITTKRAHPNG